ncbi:hypothetical protein QM716_01530 [Rhodococcus sp. IEGM 1409]|uniref:hypothetical protein n=1 Tax=Rhodococcus sp. IEGM 1409 TaxID=3047082 RepID=UPI0024B728DB|nr:hypothetical protein [Rhodococcus sp. IEGM 1409]MDI9898529.1 hypothetical protein [Rhodococcus sp. IEGM 1409]
MANLRLRVVYSVGDQVLSSVSNAVILFAMAGPSSVAEFGLAVLVFSIITASIGFVRGAAGTPLLLMSANSHRSIRVESQFASGAAAILGIGVGVIALVVSIGLSEPSVGIAYAVAAPIVLCQDALRFSSMSHGDPKHAFFSDALWAALSLVVLGVSWISPDALSIPEMIWLWSGAGFVALVYLVVALQTRPRLRGVIEWSRMYWRHRVRFGFEAGIDQLAAIVVVSVSTVYIGTEAAASLRGAVTVLGPFAVLISSLPLIVIPESIRAGHSPKQIWRTLALTAWITSMMALTIGFLAPFAPDVLGRMLLGDSWEVAIHVLPFLGLEYAAVCWISGAYNYYRAQAASERLMKYRIIQSITSIVICTVAAAVSRTAVGVAVGLALSAALIASVLVVQVMREQRIRSRKTESTQVVSSVGQLVGSSR